MASSQEKKKRSFQLSPECSGLKQRDLVNYTGFSNNTENLTFDIWN
jgi:hypothetical protein